MFGNARDDPKKNRTRLFSTTDRDLLRLRALDEKEKNCINYHRNGGKKGTRNFRQISDVTDESVLALISNPIVSHLKCIEIGNLVCELSARVQSPIVT